MVDCAARKITGFVLGTLNNCVVSCVKEGRSKSKGCGLFFSVGKEFAHALEVAKARLAADRLVRGGEGSESLIRCIVDAKCLQHQDISEPGVWGDFPTEQNDGRFQEGGAFFVGARCVTVAVKYRVAKFVDTKQSLL
jgi:hypothetical protein